MPEPPEAEALDPPFEPPNPEREPPARLGEEKPRRAFSPPQEASFLSPTAFRDWAREAEEDAPPAEEPRRVAAAFGPSGAW